MKKDNEKSVINDLLKKLLAAIPEVIAAAIVSVYKIILKNKEYKICCHYCGKKLLKGAILS